MNTLTHEQIGNRREFLRSLGRSTALFSCVALGALALRQHLRLDPASRCINAGLCQPCPLFSGCPLPRAQSARQPLATS